jgi:hypothetical protein
MNESFRGVIWVTGSKFASGKPQMSLVRIDGLMPEILSPSPTEYEVRILLALFVRILFEILKC